jgi:hypothetical protein
MEKKRSALAEGFFEEGFGGGGGTEQSEGTAGGFVGVGGFVAESDEGADGILKSGGRSAFGGGVGGQGGSDFAGAKDFVAEFDDEAFGGFFANAGAVGEELEVGVGDGGLEGVGGKAAEKTEGGFGADAGDLFDEEAEEIAVGTGGEAVELLGVLAINGEGVELDGAAGRGELFGGGDGDVDLVADAVDFHGGVQEGGFDEGAFEGDDHDEKKIRMMKFE